MGDVTLHGVLCMPPKMWQDSEVDRMQRYQRYLQASRRIEDDAREITRLRAALLVAVRQNEHDMLMTGEELRACRAALDAGRPNARLNGTP